MAFHLRDSIRMSIGLHEHLHHDVDGIARVLLEDPLKKPA